ncbi:plasmid maintenance system antidote protein VapI [Bradyrhizobium sp. AZCC 1578]|uniref:hypothetical protein n=1 Tax=Bradyrhizobium sp. AZCC 1578 TaxID=3117027 RepID=UPI002FF26E02
MKDAASRYAAITAVVRLGPDLWLNLQKRYDLERAEQELGEKINAIPTLEVAVL